MNLSTPATRAHEGNMERLKEMYRMGKSTEQIREYIENVRRTEGKFRGDALRADFGKWWLQQQEVKA